MRLLRDLRTMLRRLAASDVGSALLSAKGLLAELDTAYSAGAAVVAQTVAPRVKAVVDLARSEYAEVALRYVCCNLPSLALRLCSLIVRTLK